MKKQFYFQVILMALSFNAYSQLSAVDFDSKLFIRFKESKTYVVKTGNAEFDNALSDAMKDIWRITSYEIIDNKTFENKISDKSASFILSVIINEGSQNYHYLAIINGGNNNIRNYTYDDMIAYAPINHFQDEPENTDCAFRVRNMLQSMLDAINIVQKNNIHGSSKKIALRLMEFYQTKSPKIKDRTLLFCKSTIGNKLTKAEISAIYPFKFEMCDKAQIARVIAEKNKDYYYFQLASTLNKNMFVIDPATGETVYADWQIMGDKISKGNIEDLVKAINGKK